MHRLAIVLAVLSLGTAAHAAEQASGRRGARLVWARGEGAEACVGVRGLEEDVKGRLGWDPFTLPSDVEIEGAIVRAKAGFVAELTFRDPEGKSLGTRRFESRDSTCRVLGEAVAVAVTVAIDPDSTTTRRPPPELVPPEELPPPPAPPPVKARRDIGRVAVTGGASGGLVPGVSAVVSMRALAFAGDHVEIGLGAALWPESRSGGFGFGIAAAEARVCATPFHVSGPFRFCGGALGGLFEAFVHDPAVAPIEVGAFPWFAVEVGPAISLRLFGPLRLELGTSAIVPLLRRQANLRGGGDPVWEQRVVGARAEAGLGAIF